MRAKSWIVAASALILLGTGFAGLVLRPETAPEVPAGPALSVRLRFVDRTGLTQVYVEGSCIGATDRAGIENLGRRALEAVSRGLARARVEADGGVPARARARVKGALERGGIASVEWTLALPRDPPRDDGRIPIVVTLTWNPRTLQCKVYVGQMYLGIANLGGFHSMGRRVPEIRSTGMDLAELDYDSAVPATVVEEALRILERSKLRDVVILAEEALDPAAAAPADPPLLELVPADEALPGEPRRGR